jgi:CRP-like cAMP-binding protein
MAQDSGKARSDHMLVVDYKDEGLSTPFQHVCFLFSGGMPPIRHFRAKCAIGPRVGRDGHATSINGPSQGGVYDAEHNWRFVSIEIAATHWQGRRRRGGAVLRNVFKNSVLRSLDSDIIDRLGLQPVKFELMHEIEYPGSPIERLYFVEEGMASMTTTFKDGSQVEVGMFGYESVIGVSALMGTKKSLNRVYTQIAGHGYSCTVESARKEYSLGGEFQTLALRYVQAQLVQAIQSAGCNAKHNFEQRLARWLLICADRAHSTRFKMSHEFLADMLGGTRPTVSTAAEVLKQKGLIEYSRGEIRIIDVPGLRNTSCECYEVIKNHLDNFTEFDAVRIA